MTRRFEIATLSSGLLRPSAALATQRAGELAILDFEYVRNFVVIEESLTSLARTLPARFGVKLSGDDDGFLQNVIAVLPDIVGTVVISSRQPALLEKAVAVLRRRHLEVFFEVSSVVTARAA